MLPPDLITCAELATMPAETPITVVGAREGYGIAVGPADRVRWLSGNVGGFRLCRSADAAVAVLAACGRTRFVFDTTGGKP